MQETRNELHWTSPEEERWDADILATLNAGDPDRAEPFRIQDADQATWAFKKLRKARQELDELEAYAQRQKEKIDAWLQKEKDKPQHTQDYMEFLLVQYYKELRAQDPKSRLSTPEGKVTSRKAQPKYTFDDDKAIGYLLDKHPELVEEQIAYKYNKSEIKKLLQVVPVEGDGGPALLAVDEDGEPVSFVRVEPQEDSYSVSIDA